MRPSTVLRAVLVHLVVALALVAPPRPAEACGGVFCSATSPIPVDQNAERILFQVDEVAGTITAHVEISYSGDPQSFSWIVPVGGTPTLDVVPASVLRLLDVLTAPQIIPPRVATTGCERFSSSGPSLGCAAPASGVASPAFVEGDGGAPVPDQGGVFVEDLPRVGAFTPQVVSSTDPNALIDWLNLNLYVVTPQMEPFITYYVDLGMKFLAMKLAPDAGTADISPIKMTYPGTMPAVPLVLTAIASEPEMSIQIYVAGRTRYRSMNYENLVVDTADVRMDPFLGQTNYWALVSHQVDQAGGRAFVTQYAGPTADLRDQVGSVFLGTPDAAEAQAYVEAVLDQSPYLTRLYTRLSGWEMTDDPVFHPLDQGDVSRVHDLSTAEPIELGGCGTFIVDSVPCGTTYCGPQAQCARTDSGRDGCVCPAGQVARAITNPDPRLVFMPTVTCQRTDLDLLADVTGPGMPVDPCAGVSCGEGGVCTPVNGFPTCACDPGQAAVIVSFGATVPTCEPIVTTFGADALTWPGWPEDFLPEAVPVEDSPAAAPEPARGCTAGGGATGLWTIVLVLGLARLARRRPR